MKVYYSIGFLAAESCSRLLLATPLHYYEGLLQYWFGLFHLYDYPRCSVDQFAPILLRMLWEGGWEWTNLSKAIRLKDLTPNPPYPLPPY